MRSLSNFITEAEDRTALADLDGMKPSEARSSLANYITSNFYRLASKGSDRSLLLLLAAINVLSLGDDSRNISNARRLVLMATAQKDSSKK
jgi:hypothetical protein